MRMAFKMNRIPSGLWPRRIAVVLKLGLAAALYLGPVLCFGASGALSTDANALSTGLSPTVEDGGTLDITPLGATMRSALLPGWGQWYRGQGWLGLTYGGTFAAALCLTAYYNSQGDATYGRYQNAGTSSDATSLFNQTTALDERYRACAYATLGLYLVNVLDAFIFTRDGSRRPEQQGKWNGCGVGLYCVNRGRGAVLVMRCSL